MQKFGPMRKTLFLVTALLLLGSTAHAQRFLQSLGEEAKNAGKDDWVVSGSLEVKEGQKVTLEYDLEKGALNIILIPGGGIDEDMAITEIVEDLSDENGSSTVIRGTDTGWLELPPDTYYVKVIAEERATGSAVLRVE